MAQVKKFQTPAGPIEGTAASNPAGTPAEVKKKYGRWIRDGIAYEMDDEKIEDLRRHIAAMKPELQPYAAEEYKRVLNGKDATIDTMLNQREGVEDYAVLTDRQEKRLQNGKTKEGILNSLFNTPTHKFNVATYELGKWDPSKNMTTSKSDEVKKTKLTKLESSFAYDLTDKNVQRYKDYHNQDEMRYLKDIFNYLDGTNRDQFDVTDFDGIADIESVYKQKGGKEFAEQLINDVLAGRKVSGDYKDFLDVVGLKQDFGTNPEITQQKIDNEVATKKNADWTNSGYAGAWSINDRDKYFTHNADGTFTFKGSLPSDVNLSSGNYYFNNEFVEENPMYSYLSGKINYDGKWYSGKDLLNPESLLYRTLAAKDYFNMNKRGEYGNANEIMKASWKGQENLIPAWGEGTEDYLGDFYGKKFLYENLDYNMPNTKLRIQTGLDESGAPIYVEKDIDDNWVIRRGVDLSNTSFLPDGTGRRPWSWKITDAYGNEINDIDGISIKNKPLTYDDFIGLYDNSTVLADQNIPTPRTRISGDQYSPYYNRYADANDFGFTAYRAKDNDTVHVSIPTNIGGVEGQVYADMPVEVYNTISNKSFWEKLVENPDLNRRFNRLIREGKGKIEWKEIGNIIPGIIQDGKEYYNQDLAEAILNYFTNNPKRIASPKSLKKGGIIKAQTGTVVKNLEYSDSQKSLDKAKTLNQTYKNPYSPQMVRENGNWDLWKAIGDSDKLEMYGLAADGLGMIAGLIPVYGDLANVALSTIGANILYGISDRRKVKAGAMPKGTVGRNLAMSLGADALSLVPAIGELANMTKWGSRLKDFALKSEPFAKGLMTTFATIGAFGAADSFEKLMRGEDLNMDDFKELIYGTMSALGLVRTATKARSDSRLAKNSAPTPEQPTRTTKFKAEDGTEQTVTLDDGQISQLTSLRAMGENKSKEALATMLRNKGVPAEEINRILGNSQALKELGLIRETPRIGPTHYSEVKSEPTHGTGYYFLHPFKRTRDLQGRTVEQLFQGAHDDPRAAARWINANLGYSKIRNRKNMGTDSYDVNNNGNVKSRFYYFDNAEGTVYNYGYGDVEYIKYPTPAEEITGTLGLKKGGVIKAAKGQWFRNIGENIKTGLEKLNDPSMQNLRDNAVRFASGYFYNRKSANDQIQAGRDSLRYLQPRKLTEYYMPNVLNAGDAEKQFAQSQFQYRPAVTNDPNSYQAWKKEAYDKGNLSLANATRQYSQQDVNNGLQWVTDRRNYADAEAAGMTEFGKTVAAWKNTEAGIKDIRNRATAESFIQAIGERQKQRDVDIAAVNAANKAYADYDNELFKQSELQKAMDTYFTEDNKYDPTNPAHEKWIRDKKEEITRTYLNRGWKTTYDGLTSQQQRMYDRKYGKPVFKSGGKMRSTSDLIAINREKASDQIRVNKAKSQDRIWESSLKDARKALDKMSDRTHKILMKLLS